MVPASKLVVKLVEVDLGIACVDYLSNRELLGKPVIVLPFSVSFIVVNGDSAAICIESCNVGLCLGFSWLDLGRACG